MQDDVSRLGHNAVGGPAKRHADFQALPDIGSRARIETLLIVSAFPKPPRPVLLDRPRRKKG